MKPPSPPKRRPTLTKPTHDPMAQALVDAVRVAHGHTAASVMSMADEIGRPRGFIPTRNLALDRLLAGKGIPQGRLIEVSGWEGSGKSSALDQMIAQCQAMGGLAWLADTEDQRDRPYMRRLGVDPGRVVWSEARSIEELFDELETFIRSMASLNAVAWCEAMQRYLINVPDCPTYRHEVWDPAKKGATKPAAVLTLARWSRDQSAALAAWQAEEGQEPSGVRTQWARERLRPVTLFGTTDERKEALQYWLRGEFHPMAITADRPVLCGWDTVAGTPAEAELEGDSRKKHVAVAAKVIKQNFRRLVQLIGSEAISLVLVNQRYLNIDTTGRMSHLPPQSQTYGGSGIRFHTNVRIELTRVGKFWTNSSAKQAKEPPIGQEVEIRLHKSKQSAPDTRDRYGLVYGRGADNAWTIYHDLKDRGIIKAAAWSRFTDSSILDAEPGGDKSWQGGWMGLSDVIADDVHYPNLWQRLSDLYMEKIR